MGYLDNAKATTRGWVHKKTGELLKSQKMSQSEADALNGVSAPKAKPAPEPKVDIVKVMEEAEMENEVQQLNEAPANGKSLDEMNKIELEAIGRQHGVELDRRESKSSLLGQVKNLLG
jgi:hypothetical protein